MDEWTYRSARPARDDWQFDDSRVVEYAVNAEFLDMPADVDGPELLAKLCLRLRECGPVRAAVVVCFDDDRRNFESILRLRETLRRELTEAAAYLPIYAYLPNERGLSTLLKHCASSIPSFPLHAFGQIERIAGYRQVVRPTLKELAARIHSAYSRIEALKKELGRDHNESYLTVPQSPSDISSEVDVALAYAALSPDYKISNEDAAAHADIKLDVLGYRRSSRGENPPPTLRISAEQVEELARMEHNRWMAERLMQGWRYGPRDDAGKRRPSFMAWEHLTDRTERSKDESQLLAIVHALNEADEILESVGPVRATGGARALSENERLLASSQSG